ncbi:phosphatidylinositol-binding clathrin assembly protein-like isoform X1 [Orbicella faveolata]|uniref:phosphatidylinositol-binding clathrin assembly protein-like isoform X1 n=1 Tax=Orbicella faveolata TaxID=48498 RepID=UPI0009E3288A|nr:phosphatidylinositol-binding clathrin assembly protein-like isoform X1 [Orbicella faveolata]
MSNGVFSLLQKAKESGTSVQLPLAQPQDKPPQPTQSQKWEPLGEPAEPTPAPQGAPSDDLLQLHAAFSVPVQQSSSAAFSQSPSFPPSQAFPAAQGFGQAPPQAGPWDGSATTVSTGFSTSSSSTNPFDSQVHDDFAAVFGSQQTTVDNTPAMGDMLVPTVSSTGASKAPSDSSISGDQPGGLHASLERVAKSLDSLSFNGNIMGPSGKSQHQWTAPVPQSKTGGPNWQAPPTSRTSLPQTGWSATSQPPMQQSTGFRPPFAQPTPVGQPFMPGQQGMFPQQASAFPSQPFQPQRPAHPPDPFGPIPGSQVRF